MVLGLKKRTQPGSFITRSGQGTSGWSPGTAWVLGVGNAFASQNFPVRATVLSVCFCCLYGLLYLASTTAFNSIVTGAVLYLNITYAVPQGILAVRGRKNCLPVRPFNLGFIGSVCNILAPLLVTVFGTFICFPPELPVTVDNMNYTPVILVGLFLVILGFWYSRGHQFTGPKINWELLDLTSSGNVNVDLGLEWSSAPVGAPGGVVRPAVATPHSTPWLMYELPRSMRSALGSKIGRAKKAGSCLNVDRMPPTGIRPYFIQHRAFCKVIDTLLAPRISSTVHQTASQCIKSRSLSDTIQIQIETFDPPLLPLTHPCTPKTQRIMGSLEPTESTAAIDEKADGDRFHGWMATDATSPLKHQAFKPKTWEETDVDIRVSHCGICASDLHVLRSGWVRDISSNSILSLFPLACQDEREWKLTSNSCVWG
ncbi:MAG: hypothetical protein Q9207_004897 [Kuettlingeria erythrocarpa]